jgi:hypothetical protein
VFVPGTWYTPDFFSPVTQLLESQGYHARGVSLPTVGGPATGEDDISAIRSAIDEEISQGQDVVLIMHSRGGVSGGSSVRGY